MQVIHEHVLNSCLGFTMYRTAASRFRVLKAILGGTIQVPTLTGDVVLKELKQGTLSHLGINSCTSMLFCCGRCSQNICNPLQLEKVKDEITEASKNPQVVLLEAIHSAGYSGALGNHLMALESSLNRLNSTVLEQFVAENFTAPRMVLAVSGVEHEELLKYAEPLLCDLTSVPRPREPQSVYVGGDYRYHAGSRQTNFALAFEIPSGWLKEKEAMTLTVLQGRRWSDGLHQAVEAKEGLPIQNKTVTLASIRKTVSTTCLTILGIKFSC